MGTEERKKKSHNKKVTLLGATKFAEVNDQQKKKKPQKFEGGMWQFFTCNQTNILRVNSYLTMLLNKSVSQ